jgi:hypothetical protein
MIVIFLKKKILNRAFTLIYACNVYYVVQDKQIKLNKWEKYV